MAFRRLLLKTLLRSQNKRNLRAQKPRLVGYAFDQITAKIHIDGRFEDWDLTALENLVFPRIDPKGVCLDIGANIGNHSVAFSSHFSEVHAFEPNTNVFELLKINAKLADNIKPWNFGLSQKAQTFQVVEKLGNVGSSGVGVDAGPLVGDTMNFEMQALDHTDLNLKDKRITFVKIDVEGHEPEAIAGAKKTLERHQPIVGLEIARTTVDEGSNEAVGLLKDIGYKHFYEIPRARGLKSMFGFKPPQLVPVTALARRNYPIFLASFDPLA